MLTGRDDASVTLTLTVTDNNGAPHTTSRTVTVTNAVPVVNAGPDLGATAGVAVGMTVVFTDAGTLDTHSATLDWGDGSALFDVGTVAAGFSRSHTYAAAGTFTITACVTDDDGGVGCDTTCRRGQGGAGGRDLGAGDGRRGFVDRGFGCYVDGFRRDDRVVCVVGDGGGDVEQHVGAGADVDRA